MAPATLNAQASTRRRPRGGAWAALRMLGDRGGVAAVEFALITPFVAAAYLGGFAICEACATYRKLADAVVETANVTAQYSSMQATDAQSVMSATSVIMAPYATANLSMVLSVIQTDSATPNPNVTVVWSQAYQGGVALAKGVNTTLASSSLTQSTTYILVTGTYSYVPMFGTNYVASIPMSDSIYVLPRQSTTLPCSTC